MKSVIKIRNIVLVIAAIFMIIYSTNLNYSPKYVPNEYQNISEIVNKTELTENDYEILLQQCGLGKAGVDSVDRNELINYQTQYLNPYDVVTSTNGLIIEQYNYIDGKVAVLPLVVELQDGDVIISLSHRTMMYEHGHSSVIIDGKGMTASGVGIDSALYNTDIPLKNSRVAIIRLKKEYQELIYTDIDDLLNKPYRFFISKNNDTYDGGYCSYNTYYYFKQIGLDIDSDSGYLVTPKDILNSEYFEIVQLYRINM